MLGASNKAYRAMRLFTVSSAPMPRICTPKDRRKVTEKARSPSKGVHTKNPDGQNRHCILLVGSFKPAAQRGEVPVNPESEYPSPGLSRAAAVRVLVVEDFAAFRQFISLTLGNSPDLRVIGEVSDGWEAVQKAVELQPDLILLDIGLPGLNGIEAAREIRKRGLEAKILFLTQESSAEVIQEAFNLCAQGYIVKVKAGSDLLTAVEAVLSGKTFVSNLQASANFNFKHFPGQRP
jgi:CheY-like chemotaxis protein